MIFKIIYFNKIYNCIFFKTVLHFAAEKGNADIIKILLAYKNINANIVDTILH